MKKTIRSTFLKKIGQLSSIGKVFFGLLFLVIIYLVCLGLAPLHKINELNQWVESDSIFNSQYDTLYDHPELVMWVREKTYQEALVKLSAQDSIQLAMNLSDSTISLIIKGVRIHETKLSEYKTDRLLQNLPNHQYVKLFSQPLVIHVQRATIVKEPIVVRHAPKDTTEAALNAWQPDTLLQYPAFLRLQLAHGIQCILEQDHHPTFYDKWIRFQFKAGASLSNRLNSLANFFTLRKQEYTPTITLKLPVDDLRTIYRALPQSAHVVLYFN